ncbi:hypothetical protein HGO38_09890 [Rhizobium sp. CG5]|uniref:hypothetical protein n=1 Tax=Rhizobium sp. CG5 TaxID=2726076 RepID=UPI0020345B4A|nr:hypothetical protein [Rhizobium sp. CG5]MCM2473784.1 hypothetical protein [Rhizobium sp. CG5]
MSNERPDLAELTTEPSVAHGPGYDAWKEAKVRKALDQAKDRSKMIPADDVWESFGFER